MPSRIFDILGVSTPEENAPTATTGIHPHSSDAFVGYLRRALDFPDEGLSQAARNALAQLAHSGVGSADPQSWVDQYKYSGGSHPSQVTVSPSRVEGALECPLKEFLNSAGARDQQDTIKAEIGTLIHSIAEAFPDGGAEQIRAEFERRWGELSVREDVAGRRLKASARKKLEMLIDYLNSARERLEGREVKTEASAFGELEGIRVSAQIDRLESEGGGNWRVVDFKTGDYLPAVSSAESNPQMLIYQWLVNSGAVKGEKRAHSIGAHLIRMSRNVSRYRDDTQREVGASGMKLAEEMIRTSAALLAGPHLEARVSDACHTCRYFFVCPAQGGKRVFE
ncbi:PD-(D/E)XK nuclease family protein [Arcanobacterium wilhelmae]